LEQQLLDYEEEEEEEDPNESEDYNDEAEEDYGDYGEEQEPTESQPEEEVIEESTPAEEEAPSDTASISKKFNDMLASISGKKAVAPPAKEEQKPPMPKFQLPLEEEKGGLPREPGETPKQAQLLEPLLPQALSYSVTKPA